VRCLNIKSYGPAKNTSALSVAATPTAVSMLYGMVVCLGQTMPRSMPTGSATASQRAVEPVVTRLRFDQGRRSWKVRYAHGDLVLCHMGQAYSLFQATSFTGRISSCSRMSSRHMRDSLLKQQPAFPAEILAIPPVYVAFPAYATSTGPRIQSLKFGQHARNGRDIVHPVGRHQRWCVNFFLVPG